MTPSDGMGTQHLLNNALTLLGTNHNRRGCRRKIRGQGVPFSKGRFLPVNMRDKPQVQRHYRQPKPAKQPLQRAEGINDLSCKRQRSVSSIGIMEFQSYRGQRSRTLGVCGYTTRSAHTAGEKLRRHAEQSRSWTLTLVPWVSA